MRARNIKPGFFVNDELAEIEPLGRLLFIGLWTIADREGRLQDRPKRIKAEILPFDQCDVDTLLGELAKRGFVTRYEVDGSRYIEITNFSKHQNPHVKEQPSAIPAPAVSSASTVQAPGKSHAKPEVATLIPDSGFLIPDSLDKTLLVASADAADDTSAAIRPKKSEGPPPCPHHALVEIYHECLPVLPKVVVLTEQRKAHLQARWRQVWDEERFDTNHGLELFRGFFRRVASSRFLLGQGHGNGRDGKPPWRADLAWLVKPDNFAKVLEGRYDQAR